MKVRHKHIEKLLKRLNAEHNELETLPVDVESLIGKMGVHLTEEEFGDSLSGAAMIDGGKKIISVNKSHSEHRKRFTMAHELGHILLHEDQSLSVDVKPITFLRDDAASTGQQWREVEANFFAACILMPEALIHTELTKLQKKHLDEDELIEALAKKFNVSPQAIGIRLGALGIAAF